MFKKLFSYDTIFSSYTTAIGYGLGYIIPENLGCNMFVCIIVCLIVGATFDKLWKILSNIELFKDKRGKIMLASIIYVTYLSAWAFAYFMFDYDLDNDFFINLIYFAIVCIISFVVEQFKKGRNK